MRLSAHYWIVSQRPGRSTQGVQTETPGTMTEADAFRQNQLDDELQKWGARQALTMAGGRHQQIGLPMRRLLLAAIAAIGLALPAYAQSVPVTYDSAASTNSTLVMAGTGHKIESIVAMNTTVAVYWLKLYDKATAPTCGTDTPVQKYAIPFGATNAGAGFVIPIPDGMQFFNGIGFCLTANQANSDTNNAATGIVLNFTVKQ